MGDPSRRPVIRPPIGADIRRRVITTRADTRNVHIHNVIVDGGDSDVGGSVALRFREFASITNCIVRNTRRGVGMTADMEDREATFVARGNQIHNNWGPGITLMGGSAYVEDNVFEGNGTAINSSGASGDRRIRRNVFRDNEVGVFLLNGADDLVKGNVFKGGRDAIQTVARGTNPTVGQNYFGGMRRAAINRISGGSAVIRLDNVFSNVPENFRRQEALDPPRVRVAP